MSVGNPYACVSALDSKIGDRRVRHAVIVNSEGQVSRNVVHSDRCRPQSEIAGVSVISEPDMRHAGPRDWAPTSSAAIGETKLFWTNRRERPCVGSLVDDNCFSTSRLSAGNTSISQAITSGVHNRCTLLRTGCESAAREFQGRLGDFPKIRLFTQRRVRGEDQTLHFHIATGTGP